MEWSSQRRKKAMPKFVEKIRIKLMNLVGWMHGFTKLEVRVKDWRYECAMILIIIVIASTKIVNVLNQLILIFIQCDQCTNNYWSYV